MTIESGCPEPPEALAGRRLIITGANTGIGLAAAEKLAARGATVVLACRSAEKTRPVVERLGQQHPAATVRFERLDLGSPASIRACAARLLAAGEPIDALINNAGVSGLTGLTEAGVEMTVGVNYVGHAMLTDALLPLLKAAPQGRIVNVTSRAHEILRRVPWRRLERPCPRVLTFQMYALSKLFNIIHARVLAGELRGSRVTAVAVHPGAVASDIWRRLPEGMRRLTTRRMIGTAEGAAPSVYCATAPELASTTGAYFNRCREEQPGPLAADPEVAARLTEWTARVTAGAR
ncbi:MAG TPA: SDR family NAD(P)-dependent oxidoreductase [Gemmatimonadales bacterium]|nr:SDR family NAD(P)-dependent oxidoreductase [Gemmatimonadales bacterium]